MQATVGPALARQADAEQVSPEQNIPALCLEQTHFYWGKTEVIVSNSGLRVQNKGALQYILVACAPDWKVTVFRQDDKTMLSEKFSDFAEEGLVSNFVISKQQRTLGPGKTIPVNYGQITVSSLRREPFYIEYLPLGKYPKQIEELLYSIYRQPTNGGLPIRCVKHSKGVDWMTGLKESGQKASISTQSISKIMVKRKDFEPPAGLKRVPAMQEVLMSKAKRTSAGETSELFDLR